MEVLESSFFCRYEKLHRWEDALAAYSTKAHSATSADELQSATLGLFLDLPYRTKNNFTSKFSCRMCESLAVVP
jgi:hypothetical protein